MGGSVFRDLDLPLFVAGAVFGGLGASLLGLGKHLVVLACHMFFQR